VSATPFDLYYVVTSWTSSNEGRVEHHNQIPPDAIRRDANSHNYRAEAGIFPRVAWQPAGLAITSGMSGGQDWTVQNPPRLLLDGIPREMVAAIGVIDGLDGAVEKRFWIEKNWVKPVPKKDQRGYHHCSAYNTVGNLTFVTPDDHYVRVHTVERNLTTAEWHALLATFRGEWFRLLLSNHSLALTQDVGQTPDDRLLEPVRQFCSAVRQILRKPECEIKEALQTQRTLTLPPTPETVRIVARYGGIEAAPAFVAAPGHVESVDTPVNRYIAYLTGVLEEYLEGIRVAAEGTREIVRLQQEQLSHFYGNLHQNLAYRSGPRESGKLLEETFSGLEAQLPAMRVKEARFDKLEDACRKLGDELRGLRGAFVRLGILPSARQPDSLLLARHPSYAGAYRAYRQTLEEADLDEPLLTTVLLSRQYTPLDMALVYERWCVLRILRCLQDVYHFRPDEGAQWCRRLVDALGGGRQNPFSLRLSNREIGCHIVLHVQTEYFGKRPDIRLDFSSWDEDQPVARLICDAKYHDYTLPFAMRLECDLFRRDENGASGIVWKYYADVKRRRANHELPIPQHVYVFVLHPCDDAGIAPEAQTGLSWSGASTYGGAAAFGKSEQDVLQSSTSPNHRWGGVRVRPGDSGDDLQRLIGMTLQRGIVPLHNCCIVCGGTDLRIEASPHNQSVKYVWCINPNCCHFYVHSFCRNCRKPLFKHAGEWTFHTLATPTELWNIACPVCGDHL
jgi:hypothetical protein